MQIVRDTFFLDHYGKLPRINKHSEIVVHHILLSIFSNMDFWNRAFAVR